MSTAQFNEQLEKEILAVNETFVLDSIERGLASLNRLEEILSVIDSAELATHLLDDPWKYSHSVTNEARKFRNSSSIYVINFRLDSGSYMITKKEGPSVPIGWKNDNSLLQIDLYESKTLEFTKSIFWGIHSIISDRLVIAKVIRSKNYPNMSAIIYEVYFRD